MEPEISLSINAPSLFLVDRYDWVRVAGSEILFEPLSLPVGSSSTTTHRLVGKLNPKVIGSVSNRLLSRAIRHEVIVVYMVEVKPDTK